MLLYQTKNEEDGALSSNSILMAPHMRTVTSLESSCSICWLVNDGNTIENVLQIQDTLPLLKLLGYRVHRDSNRSEFPDKFIAARSITRLYYRGSLGGLDQELNSCANLEYFLVEHFRRGLATTVERQPEVFTRLKHIGAVTLSSSEEGDVLRELEPFEGLKSLITIEISHIILPSEDEISMQKYPPNHFKPSQSVFQLLGEKHHSLSRIHVVNTSYQFTAEGGGDLWEQGQDGIWAGRAIPHLSRWDVLNGMLDSV